MRCRRGLRVTTRSPRRALQVATRRPAARAKATKAPPTRSARRRTQSRTKHRTQKTNIELNTNPEHSTQNREHAVRPSVNYLERHRLARRRGHAVAREG